MIRHIAATHHVNICIDTSVVRLPAIQRVSLDAEGVTLKTALELLLDQVGDFTFYIQDNCLVISNQVEQRIKPRTKSRGADQ